MAELVATRASRGHRTLCLPFAEEAYLQIIHDPAEFRRAIDERFRTMPRVGSPPTSATDTGSRTTGSRPSSRSRSAASSSRMAPPTASGPRSSCPTWSPAPMTSKVPLFLRKFAVPFWALARVFGRDPM